ncbi:hypothetical protein GCM10010295_04760 [Streptomyces intermedius]|nr:hypothetical protein CWE27_00520 [Streptomyces sp. EAG2]
MGSSQEHRHAPGFPPGCPDSGDVLRAYAGSGASREVTLVVVTSALRARVEAAGGHERGLAAVRTSLARIGDRYGSGWSPSYYGKDLVLVRPGRHVPEEPGFPQGAGAVRHGWAWDHVSLPAGEDTGTDALLRACYLVSMAARLRRDDPGVPQHAPSALDTVPGRLTARAAASLLAGVLVRPYEGTAAGPEEDPRMPGVPSADGWPAAAATARPGHWLVMTDVHDIEWGTVGRGEDGARLTTGNAEQLLELAAAWHSGRPTPEVADAAYGIRQQRERQLVGHLAILADGVRDSGRLYGTFGDGLCGFVADPAVLRSALREANRTSTGHLASGAGLAAVGTTGLDAARSRATFALHVTKTLKGTQHPPDGLHLFGTVLGVPAAEAALGFLERLREAGPGAPGAHHLDHAHRHREHWTRHLPATHRDRAAALLSGGRHAPA